MFFLRARSPKQIGIQTPLSLSQTDKPQRRSSSSARTTGPRRSPCTVTPRALPGRSAAGNARCTRAALGFPALLSLAAAPRSPPSWVRQLRLYLGPFLTGFSALIPLLTRRGHTRYLLSTHNYWVLIACNPMTWPIHRAFQAMPSSTPRSLRRTGCPLCSRSPGSPHPRACSPTSTART